jgi:hypothetical protein
LSQECIHKREEYLMQLLVKGHKSFNRSSGKDIVIPDSTDQLRLATTWFNCTGKSQRCRIPLDLEEIHRHKCMSRSDIESETYSEHIHLQWAIGEQAWNVNKDRVEYDPQAAKTGWKVVKACGKDPLVTTTEEMDTCKPRFLWVRDNKAKVVSWRGVVSFFWVHQVFRRTSSLADP